MLIRELLPELDDEQFRRLETYVSSTSLLERLGTASNTPDSESIVRLSAPVLKALGPTAEPSMFHALIAQLAEGERDNVERAVAASGYAARSRLPLLVSQFLENLTARLTNFYLRPLVAHIKRSLRRGFCMATPPKNGMKTTVGVGAKNLVMIFMQATRFCPAFTAGLLSSFTR